MKNQFKIGDKVKINFDILPSYIKQYPFFKDTSNRNIIYTINFICDIDNVLRINRVNDDKIIIFFPKELILVSPIDKNILCKKVLK